MLSSSLPDCFIDVGLFVLEINRGNGTLVGPSEDDRSLSHSGVFFDSGCGPQNAKRRELIALKQLERFDNSNPTPRERDKKHFFMFFMSIQKNIYVYTC